MTKVSTNQTFAYKFFLTNDYCEISFAGIILFLKQKTEQLKQYSKDKKDKKYQIKSKKYSMIIAY